MYMCYHAESDHSALKGVGINTRERLCTAPLNRLPCYGALEVIIIKGCGHKYRSTPKIEEH